MFKEVPFHMPQGRSSRRQVDLAPYREELARYGKGIGALSRYLMWHHEDGVVTIGNSAECMWRDMQATSFRNLAILPRATHLIGDKAYDLYAGKAVDMERAFKRQAVTLKNKVIVEDYADRGHKIINLYELYQRLGFPVRFAVLYAAPHAELEFLDYGIPVHIVIKGVHEQLQNLLETRRNRNRFARRAQT